MPSPVGKGVRDYESTYPTSTVIVDETSTTRQTTTQCTSVIGTYSQTYECSTSSSITIPPTPTTISKTYVPPTSTKTLGSNCSQGEPQTLLPTFAPDTKSFYERNSTTKFLDPQGEPMGRNIPWSPIGVCGLAKWIMADRGDPSFGVKKDPVIKETDVLYYAGRIRIDDTIIGSNIDYEVNKGIVHSGVIAESHICNQEVIQRGMEGYVKGSFIWRLNLQRPLKQKLFPNSEGDMIQEVDGVSYPVGWRRIVVLGVKCREGKVTHVACMTKYGAVASEDGTGIKKIIENTHSGSWSGTATLHTEAVEQGYEGDYALVPVEYLYDHDASVGYKFLLQEKSMESDAINLSDVTVNVGNDISFPMSVDENIYLGTPTIGGA